MGVARIGVVGLLLGQAAEAAGVPIRNRTGIDRVPVEPKVPTRVVDALSERQHGCLVAW